MKTLLWIDDIRNPHSSDWLMRYSPFGEDCCVFWVKSYMEFLEYFKYHSIPDGVCFDNDLGPGKEGYDCAKWLVDKCLDEDRCFPEYRIQSSNAVARENITSLIENYKNHYATSRSRSDQEVSTGDRNEDI